MVRKTPLFSNNLYFKTMILPRQARDKCRETLKKREPFFEQAALNQGIARQVRDSDDAVIIAATTSPSLLSLLSFMSGTFRWFLVLYLISGSFAWRQMLHRLVQLNSSSMAPEAGGLYNPTRGTVQPVRKTPSLLSISSSSSSSFLR